jgi:hypothetical protein
MPHADDVTRALAVYTTVYPGVEAFLASWHRSLREQTDGDFHLWVGLHGIDAAAATKAMGGGVEATWVPAAPTDTPAGIRQRALALIVEDHAGIVLVDSDDLLHPSRVAAARAALAESELGACAMRLVDVRGRDLGVTLGLGPLPSPEAAFPRNNIFGLSNSAYRSTLLRRCLPISTSAVAVDWLLATRAWLLGATMHFDPIVRMDYRQHGENIVRTVGPFDDAQIVRDTELVLHHYELVEAQADPRYLPERVAELRAARGEAVQFCREVIRSRPALAEYRRAINQMQIPPLWWSSVAHPGLRHMWHP